MHVLVTRFPYESAVGGEELHTLNVIDFCTQESDTVTVLTSCNVLSNLLKSIATIVPCTVGKMPVTPFTACFAVLFFPDIRYRIRRAFKIIHASNPVTHVYCLSLMDKICITPIALQHNCRVIWVEHQYLRRWFQKSPFLFLYRKYASKVSIVPISPVNKKILRSKGIPTTSIVDIVHGVNLQEFKEVRSHTIPKKIGVSARLHPKKGIDLLVQAFPAILALHPDAQLEISGDGPSKNALQRMCKEFSIDTSVHFSSRYSRKEYGKFLHSCSTFVLPSVDESETFGLVVAEAMLCGCSIVVTNVCGIAHYLEDNAGIHIVDPEIQSIADAILSSFETSETARQENVHIATKLFDEKRMLEEYKQLLSD